ncbi:DUF6275 family protein [Weissella tructae]
MDGQEFINIAQRNLANRFPNTTPNDWYTVWQVRVLQNNKALLSTDVFDGKYVEVTYNGDKQEMYIDVYGHETNTVVHV